MVQYMKGGGPISAILWMVVVMPAVSTAGTLDTDARAAWVWATAAPSVVARAKQPGSSLVTSTRPVDVTTTAAGKCRDCSANCQCGCQDGEPCRCAVSKPVQSPVIYYRTIPSQPVYYYPSYSFGGYGGFSGGACAGGG